MKRRLLAFLLAFVMTFSLVPVNTFAAEADAAALYTNITTESGENVPSSMWKRLLVKRRGVNRSTHRITT